MGWRTGGLTLLIALGLLALPGSVATAVTGALTVDKSAIFPAGTGISLSHGAVIVPLSLGTGPFNATADAVRVWVFEHERIEAASLAQAGIGTKETSWSVDDAAITLRGHTDGFLALDAAMGLTVTVVAPTAVTHQRDSFISHDGAEYSDAPPGNPQFQKRFREDHIQFSAPGHVLATGTLALKAMGAELIITSRENESRVVTGRTQDAGGRATYRWVYLEVEGAALELASPRAHLKAGAVHASRVEWDGLAAFRLLDGQIFVDNVAYHGRGEAEIEGSISAALYPVPDGRGRLRLTGLEGNLRFTSLAPEPAASKGVPLGGAGEAGALIAIGMLIAGAAGAFAVTRHGRRLLRLGRLEKTEAFEDRDNVAWCVAWAHHFEDREDLDAALECVLAASAYAEEPDYDLVLWAGGIEERRGRWNEALAHFEAALALAPKGETEAAFSAACGAAILGQDEKALTNLRIALMADPALLWAVETYADGENGDDPFRALRTSQDFRQLMRDARRWARS